MRHLGSIADLSSDEVLAILDRAEELRAGAPPTSRPGHVLALAFFESSTRTRVGFASAAIRSGWGTVDLSAGRHGSEMSAPESLSDTIRVVSAYSDAMVLRHPASDAWATAVAHTRCPLINGGNGNDEHPTQALIDLFAIRKATGRLEGLNVGIVGDICGSRAAHSLIKALSRLGQAEIRLMGPGSRLDSAVAAAWGGGAGHVTIGHDLVLADLDVLYVAGLPEGTGSERLSAFTRATFSILASRITDLPAWAAVLCPLPRIDEISQEVAGDVRCRFFQQSDDGESVRMAVLERSRERVL